MNTSGKKLVFILLAGIYFFSASQAQASPWAEKQGYWNKTGSKFTFGLTNSVFGWLSPWTEAKNPKYKKEWEGFSAGIGQAVVYTAGGLIQLVTFPIPVDIPDIQGLHIPQQNCPKAPFGVNKSAVKKEIPAEPAVIAEPAPVAAAEPVPTAPAQAPPAAVSSEPKLTEENPEPTKTVKPVKTLRHSVKKSAPRRKAVVKTEETENSADSELAK